MSTPEQLRAELAVYDRHKDELLQRGEGRYVLIGNGAVESIWDTYEDALQAGYQKFGLRPFLVKQIEAFERVQFVLYAASRCRR